MDGRGVAGLLLTGGSSRRMGRDKAGLVMSGERLADRAARALRAAADPVLEVGPGFTSLPAVREEPPGGGPLAAVAEGGRRLRDRGHAGPILVLAVDLVHAEEGLLRFLAGYPADRAVLPVDEHGRDQPLCARYEAEDLERAAELVGTGAASMRELLDHLDVNRVQPEEWLRVAPPDAFHDLDTPEDLDRMAQNGGR
ncbi:MAG: NTP transferase domain-containing protein [Actinomycetota bacterium]